MSASTRRRAARHASPRRFPPALTGALLVALAFVLFATLALRIPLSSEVRYIEAAREMVESGDWIVPHLGYVPYFEKPILVYWSSALGQRLGGDSLVAARLPSILGSCLSLWATWRLARGLGERVALRSAFVLLVSAFFLVLGSVLMTDPLFSCWLWCAWCAYWVSLESARRRWKWIFWLCVALAFLTKGPLALILGPGAIVVFHVLDAAPGIVARPSGRLAGAWGAWTVRVRRGVRTAWSALAPWTGAIVLLAVNLPWSYAVWRRDPRFLTFFYVRENFQAFFDGQVHHRQSFAFYAGVLFNALAPFSLPAVLGLGAALRSHVPGVLRGRSDPTSVARPDRLRTYLLAIVVFTLAFLQASSAKLATYVLPIVPALVVLIVDAWSRADAAGRRWPGRALFAGVALVVAGIGVYALVERQRVRELLAVLPSETRTVVLTELAVTLLALFAGGVVALRRVWTGVFVVGAATAIFIAAGSQRMVDIESEFDVASLARTIAARATPAERVVVTSQFVQDYTLELELRRRVACMGHAHELGMGFFAESTAPDVPIPREPYHVDGGNLPQNPWLYTRERLAAEWTGAARMWLVCSEREAGELEQSGLHVVRHGTADEAVLCSNRP